MHNKQRERLRNIIATVSMVAMLPLAAITFSPNAEANTCRIRANTGALNQAVRDYCQNRADTTRPNPNAEKGEVGWIPYFFENPDECDLGINFPDLIPDFNFSLSKINSCEILRAVSAKAVSAVNTKFNEIEGDLREATGGDFDKNVDLGDIVGDRIGGGNN